jgi:hypothetical protein
MWGATRTVSAVLRSFVWSHGHRYSTAITAELVRLDKTLIPNISFVSILFSPERVVGGFGVYTFI